MNETSRALPAHYYRDPAEVVERNELDTLGCRACQHGKDMLGRVLCTDPRNEKQKGVPHVGHRCKLFREKP